MMTEEMKKHANVLSKVQFQDKILKNRENHILMAEFDSKSCDLNKLTQFCNQYGIRIHVIETSRGFHFISFACLNEFEVDEIQNKLLRIFPSDYPTILKIRKEDESQGQEFNGTTLRITSKGTDLKYYGFYDPTTKEMLEKASKQIISGGHLYLYSLITEHHIAEIGCAVNTRLILCSFLKNNRKELIL